MTIIIGIDPGSRCTGYGIIDASARQPLYVASGYIRLSTDDVAKRMYQIESALSELISQYQVQHMAIEQVFMHANPGAALKLGQARGAALVAAGRYALELAEYTARQIKQSVVGYGAADKQQVQHMVQMLLNHKQPLQSDEADALACAIYHAHHSQTNAGLLAQMKLRRGRLR